jgi:hypothetical protein
MKIQTGNGKTSTLNQGPFLEGDSIEGYICQQPIEVGCHDGSSQKMDHSNSEQETSTINHTPAIYIKGIVQSCSQGHVESLKIHHAETSDLAGEKISLARSIELFNSTQVDSYLIKTYT